MSGPLRMQRLTGAGEGACELGSSSVEVLPGKPGPESHSSLLASLCPYACHYGVSLESLSGGDSGNSVCFQIFLEDSVDNRDDLERANLGLPLCIW
jgi:hypothetical protein